MECNCRDDGQSTFSGCHFQFSTRYEKKQQLLFQFVWGTNYVRMPAYVRTRFIQCKYDIVHLTYSEPYLSLPPPPFYFLSSCLLATTAKRSPKLLPPNQVVWKDTAKKENRPHVWLPCVTILRPDVGWLDLLGNLLHFFFFPPPLLGFHSRHVLPSVLAGSAALLRKQGGPGEAGRRRWVY